ncbi:hypothetical protein ES703_84138 [subsurface metagenome]
MRKVAMWAVGICLLPLVVVVTGCQCGAPATTSTPPPTPAPTPTLSPSPAPTPTPTPPALTMTLYENGEHGFSIEYPEGWTERSGMAGIAFSLVFRDPDGHVTEDVTVEYRTEEITLTDAVSEGKEYFEEYVPQFELISEGDVTIGAGISGYEIIGQADIGTGKVERFRYVVLVREKQVFWLGVRSEPDRFDEQKQLIDTVMGSFKFLPTYTFVPPTPSEGGTYTNAEYGFSISCPAGWTEDDSGQYGSIISLWSAEGLPGVTVTAWTEETTLAEAALKLKTNISKHIRNYELFSEGEVTLDDGTPAYEIVFSGIFEESHLKCKAVIVIQEANVFVMESINIPARFEQDEPVLDEVIRSFHLE